MADKHWPAEAKWCCDAQSIWWGPASYDPRTVKSPTPVAKALAGSAIVTPGALSAAAKTMVSVALNWVVVRRGPPILQPLDIRTKVRLVSKL